MSGLVFLLVFGIIVCIALIAWGGQSKIAPMKERESVLLERMRAHGPTGVNTFIGYKGADGKWHEGLPPGGIGTEEGGDGDS